MRAREFQHIIMILFVSSLFLDEALGSLLTHGIDVAHFVYKLDSVELVCGLQKLGPEGGGDELCILRQFMDHS